MPARSARAPALWCGNFVLPAPNQFDNGWHQGNTHDGNDHQMEIPLHDFTLTEKIPSKREGGDPSRPSRDAVPNEAPKSHLADAGHKRCKRPQDRRKAGDDDGLTSVAFVESLRPQQMFPVQ